MYILIKKESVKNEPIKISAKELYKAYDDNEVSADKKYSGNTGIITGKIREIPVISGRPFISLSNGDSNSIIGVNCYFSDTTQSDKIGTLKKEKL